MIGIPYIKSLFKAILSQSKVMQGRFHICPYWGNEINKINIAELVDYVATKDAKEQKYPCGLLMPIMTTGNFQYTGMDNVGTTGYSMRQVNLVFLAKPYTTGQNQTFNQLPNGMPQHDIPDTWHDMERCATDFIAVLNKVIVNAGLEGTLYISEQRTQEIHELTNKGNDGVSGVLLRFYLGWNSGCDVEDYPDNYLDLIQVPDVVDTHPSHSM